MKPPKSVIPGILIFYWLLAMLFPLVGGGLAVFVMYHFIAKFW